MALYVVGMGANLGDRLGHLRLAASALLRFEGARFSAVYETDPVGPPQPDYLNAAVAFESALLPRSLLHVLQGIEAELGRVRRERWGPRTIDLDILWSDEHTVHETELCIPHAALRLRAFALVPLLELVPRAKDERGIAYVPPQEGIRKTDYVLP